MIRIISRRCDIPMRKSKEKGKTHSGRRWRCTQDCKNCICCLEKHQDGSESHFNPLYMGGYEVKGE